MFRIATAQNDFGGRRRWVRVDPVRHQATIVCVGHDGLWKLELGLTAASAPLALVALAKTDGTTECTDAHGMVPFRGGYTLPCPRRAVVAALDAIESGDVPRAIGLLESGAAPEPVFEHALCRMMPAVRLD